MASPASTERGRHRRLERDGQECESAGTSASWTAGADRGAEQLPHRPEEHGLEEIAASTWRQPAETT